MNTQYNKLVMAILGGLATVLTQKYGITLDPDLVSSIGAAITALLVYVVPNKA